MKFPILWIIYVLVQIFSCIQSDVPAEELVQTNPIINTSAYSAFDSESETEDIPSSNSPPNPSLVTEIHDVSQERYVTISSPNLPSSTASGITWHPVSSVVHSTDAEAKDPVYENTFPSSFSQNSTEHSGANAFNYRTAPSIFEYLDHEENELDSDARVTDMSKGLKTTLNPDFPPLYANKFETIRTESLTDSSQISYGSVHQLLSESENEPNLGRTTMVSTPFEYNRKNSSLSSISNDTEVETSTSVSVTNFPNLELSTESGDTSRIWMIGGNVSDSNLFDITEDTSENLHRSNMSEIETVGNTTLITDDIKFLYNDNIKSTASQNTEFVVENREQESNLYSSSLDTNSTYVEESKDLESVNTISFQDNITSKSTDGLKPASRLNFESTPTSLFSEQSETISKIPTTVVLQTMDTNTFAPEKFSPALSETSPLDPSLNVKILPAFHNESLPQNFSDKHSFQSSSQENYLSSVTEVTTSSFSFTTPIELYEDVVTTSTLINNKPLTSDASVITTESGTDASAIFQPSTAAVLTEIEKSGESTTVVLPSIHSTKYLPPSNDEIGQTAMSSLENGAYSEIVTTSHSFVNIFKPAIKLSTTTDPNMIRITDKMNYSEIEYHDSTRTSFSTTVPNEVEESSTVASFPAKNMGRENSTDFVTEHSTVPQTIPYHPLLSTTVSSNIDGYKSSSIDPLSPQKDVGREGSTYQPFTEQGTVSEAVSYDPLSSTTFEQSLSFVTHNIFSSFKPLHDNKGETTTSRLESYTSIDEIVPGSYSTETAATLDASSVFPETHREGKHIPFSSASTIRATDLSSEHGFILVTTERTPVNDLEVQYMQIQIEDVNQVDRTNMITAIIQFPIHSVNKTDMKIKLARTHLWLDKVLTKEFWNWTRDPFEEVEDQDNEIPFGNISIFYVKPTPETNASHITLTFIVYNAWKNRTLPVHFVLGTLNFYSKELKDSINASAAYFYHGLSTENYDLLSAVLDKYGIIIFTICLAVVGITILVCVVIFYRKKTRQSIHYLADSKLQQNLQEAVGIDLTPASIILQDEKEEKGNKICDDEGWLVPITDVPVAEDNNVPIVQDTKL